jgi:hypothetical protein
MSPEDQATIKQHAAGLREIARQTDVDGIGQHPLRGHAVYLRHMAACMCADAAQGIVPYIHEDPGGVRWSGEPTARL